MIEETDSFIRFSRVVTGHWLRIVSVISKKNEVKNEKSIIGFHFYFLAYLTGMN